MPLSYALGSAALPTKCTIPEENLQLLDDFFVAVDTDEPERMGRRLADEIFASDGTWIRPSHIHKGSYGT